MTFFWMFQVRQPSNLSDEPLPLLPPKKKEPNPPEAPPKLLLTSHVSASRIPPPQVGEDGSDCEKKKL